MNYRANCVLYVDSYAFYHIVVFVKHFGHQKLDLTELLHLHFVNINCIVVLKICH